ncbi:hypothetical protein COO60DRAFT_1517104 [Scenedesmus sp. NREL 46B-D3]|nr:hypothetical protein COO60DRAFT_1517104 [Scenedesmus sp. NREL 46B-D3]
MEHASQRPMSIQLICTLHFLAFIVPTTISSEFRLQGCATYALFEVLDLVTFMWSYIAVGLYSIHATVQPMMSATASVRPVELMKVNLLSWVAADAADNSTVLPKLATYPQCASVLASFAVTLSSFKRMLLSGTASTVAGLGLHCPFAAAKEASSVAAVMHKTVGAKLWCHAWASARKPSSHTFPCQDGSCIRHQDSNLAAKAKQLKAESPSPLLWDVMCIVVWCNNNNNYSSSSSSYYPFKP